MTRLGLGTLDFSRHINVRHEHGHTHITQTAAQLCPATFGEAAAIREAVAEPLADAQARGRRYVGAGQGVRLGMSPLTACGG